MKNRSLVSISDYTLDEQLYILKLAAEFEKNPRQKILENHVVASLFFEPSTRTRLSFESAASQLSAKIVGFSEAGSSSVSKGESLKDTILTVSNYSDIIVMRHPREGSAKYADEVAPIPIINATSTTGPGQYRRSSVHGGGVSGCRTWTSCRVINQTMTKYAIASRPATPNST